MRILKSASLLIFLVASSLPLFAQDIPVSILRALNNAPEDYMVGIGAAKAETDWDSMSLAETLARVDLARSISSEAEKIIRDFTAESKLTGESIRFSEEIWVTTTAAYIWNSWIAELEKEIDGTWWCVLYLGKSGLAREIEQAQAATRLHVPPMFSFDAEARMNEAFEMEAKEKED